ncbi:MAG: leucine-rich repeat protein [Candidatus Methanomethylophilaceae archaeon]|nr:leucine-rich repeat protein [Candidatus Methanomethylophilaceae archaeon]
MAILSFRCPNCSEETYIDGSEEYGYCRSCGFKISVKDAIELFDAEAPEEDAEESLKDFMFACYDSGDYPKAREVAEQILSRNREDADAWYIDGVCTLDESDYPMDSDAVKDAMGSFEAFTKLTGLEVDIDAESFKRYLKLAEGGDVRAQHRVGTMYSRGMGVAQSQEKAMAWFKKAYERGCKEARPEISNAIRWTEGDSYTVPSFIDEIWDGMFEGTSFKSVTIPEPISRIGNRAFANCSRLESVKLPRTLKSIGDEAFYRCKALRPLDIPASVKIGVSAFYGSGTEARPSPATAPSRTGTSPAKPSYEPPPRVPYSSLNKVSGQIFVLETVIFSIALLYVIWSNLDPIVALVVTVAPVIVFWVRGIAIKDDIEMLAMPLAMEVLLIIAGLFFGFFNSAYHLLSVICLVDVILTVLFIIWMESEK